jgi:predicted Zn-dependent protease
MKRFYRVAIVVLHIILFSCSTVPITGRKQLDLVPDSEMLSMSLTQYNEFLESHQISRDQEKVDMVKRVGNRIEEAVEQYFNERGMGGRLKDYQWEFNLIESEEVNAWCMPGARVVVYNGILPVTRTEAGLAVVMGHEIGHAVAKHGDERMSQALLAQLGGMALSEALEEEPEKTRQLWLSVYGLGAQVGVLLPFSRIHENEADHLGLIFMAMAGYHPGEAIDFWKRMMAQKQSGAQPEFLSTHPSDATRIDNMKKLLPEAMKYYSKGGQ